MSSKIGSTCFTLFHPLFIFFIALAHCSSPTLLPSYSPTPVTTYAAPTPSPTFNVRLNTTQLNVLKKLYDAMAGPSWSYIKGAGTWNFSRAHSDPCLENWMGVYCIPSLSSPSIGVVQSLSLNNVLEVARGATIPSEIGILTNLEKLYLDNNGMVGSIPSSLAKLTLLRELGLGTNSFSGTMPSLRGLNLTHFTTAYSPLVGTFPAWLLSMTKLRHLDLLRSKLTGTLPSQLGSLSALSYLGLDKCRFKGTVPASLGSLTNLVKLAFNGNKLTGSLPGALGNLGSVTYLGFHVNSLSGQIPNSLSKLSNLVTLRGNDNLLSGSFPRLAGMGALQQLDLFNNTAISGPLPDSLSGLSGLTKLDVSNMSLTGPLIDLSGFTTLKYLALFQNSFTRTLPQRLEAGALPNLIVLYAHRNRLTGTIPVNIGLVMPQLSHLILSENSISGSIPSSIGSLTALIVLKLDVNRLTSGDTFGSAAFVRRTFFLRFIGLANNFFDGTIPSALFSSSNLATVALSSNCFQGSLPASVCNAASLEYLVIDGLSSGSSCRQPYLAPGTANPLGLNGTFALKAIDGSLPSCLFSLPRLRSLHMSGNGISGSIPSNLPFPPNLTEVVLSNNMLRGTIPSKFHLMRQFKLLDLSYNQISGVLDPDLDLAPDAVLMLKINKLSGLIPSNVLKSQNADILRGNLFDCQSRSELPRTDPWIHNFQCGSIGFDKYVYFFLAVIVTSVAVLSVVIKDADVLRFKGGKSSSIFTFNKLEKIANQQFRDTIKVKKYIVWFGHILLYTRKIALCVAGVIILVFIPLYGILTATSGSYQFEYSWTVSGIFKTGVAPAAVLLVFWSFVVVLPTILIRHYFEEDAQAQAEDKAAISKSKDANIPPTVALNSRNMVMYFLLCFRLLAIVLINCVATLTANITFVDYSTRRGFIESSFLSSTVGLKLALSLFKLVWNLQILRWLCGKSTLDMIGQVLKAQPEEIKALSKTSTLLKGSSIFELLLLVFNNIVAPCVANALVDPVCFYHVFYAMPKVSAAYTVLDCQVSAKHIQNGAIDDSQIKENCWNRDVTTTYDPSFSYKDECTSVLIQNYAPVLILVTLWPAFGRPLKDFLIRQILDVQSFWCWPSRTGITEEMDRKSSSIEDRDESEEEEQKAKWEKLKAYYCYLLQLLSSELLWIDRDIALMENSSLRGFNALNGLSIIIAQTSQSIIATRDELAARMSRRVQMPPRNDFDQSRSVELSDASTVNRLHKDECIEPEATGREVDQLKDSDSSTAKPPSSSEPDDTPIKAVIDFLSATEPKPAIARVKYVDVPQYFMEVLSDLATLQTFGIICPLIAIAQAVSIASRALQWQTMIRNFIEKKKDKKLPLHAPSSAIRANLANQEAVELLNEDCRAIYGGANPSKAKWVLTVVPILFLGLFLRDMAAQEAGMGVAMVFPVLLLIIPLGAIFCLGDYCVQWLSRGRVAKRSGKRTDGPRSRTVSNESDSDDHDSFNDKNVVPGYNFRDSGHITRDWMSAALQSHQPQRSSVSDMEGNDGCCTEAVPGNCEPARSNSDADSGSDGNELPAKCSVSDSSTLEDDPVFSFDGIHDADLQIGGTVGRVSTEGANPMHTNRKSMSRPMTTNPQRLQTIAISPLLKRLSLVPSDKDESKNGEGAIQSPGPGT